MRRFRLGFVSVLCAAGILFGTLWLAAPLFAGHETGTAPTAYCLRDAGGRVGVYADEQAATPLAVYDIYVNLLPESDVLRLKSGIPVADAAALEQLLEDLGR